MKESHEPRNTATVLSISGLPTFAGAPPRVFTQPVRAPSASILASPTFCLRDEIHLAFIQPASLDSGCRGDIDLFFSDIRYALKTLFLHLFLSACFGQAAVHHFGGFCSSPSNHLGKARPSGLTQWAAPNHPHRIFSPHTSLHLTAQVAHCPTLPLPHHKTSPHTRAAGAQHNTTSKHLDHSLPSTSFPFTPASSTSLPPQSIILQARLEPSGFPRVSRYTQELKPSQAGC